MKLIDNQQIDTNKSIIDGSSTPSAIIQQCPSTVWTVWHKRHNNSI